jgi:hypothetical protein
MFNRLFSFIVISTALAACASTTAPSTASAAETTAAPTCNDLAASARKEVSAAIESNASCNADADCVAIGFAASCFDSCARTVASSGVAAVSAAKSKVDGAQCKQFLDQGCKVMYPPCVPRPPAKCTAGKCVM